MINDLLLKRINSQEPHPRKINRFSSSEIYNITTGELKPEDFFKPKVFDLKACQNIRFGEVMEDALTDLFDFNKVKYEGQVKKVKTFGEFDIVAKPDYVFADKILECKSPTRMPRQINEWNKCQCECYFRVFNLPVWVIYLTHHFSYKIFKYEPNDELWKMILFSLNNFHKQLVELND